MWPEALEEVLQRQTGALEFRPASLWRRERPSPPETRTRPLNLAVLVGAQGHHRYGYVVGLRAGEDGSLVEDFDPAGWDWLEAGEIRAEGASLVVLDASGEASEVPLETLRRVLRTNRMHLPAKARLTLQRLREVWLERTDDGHSGLTNSA